MHGRSFVGYSKKSSIMLATRADIHDYPARSLAVIIIGVSKI